ncbi:MAG: Lrp/AsnC family transcriptional regulator [Eubacterium sp.]|nr:Lrp/AsnC family transcriptional regulator [Eubacterium sp.]
MEKLLSILENNPRLSNKEIAVMLGTDEKTVEAQIRQLEDGGIVKGYRALIDNEKTESQLVTALIEIKVQPKFSRGFEDIAQKIARLDEVESVYLMSGSFDICCLVTDKSFQEVALFVANRLSPMEGVVSTATHFILKKYKEQGVSFMDAPKDDRRKISF